MNTKVKVLYAITKSDIGGAQKYVADLAAHLNQGAFESKILYGGQDLKWLSNKVWPWLLFLNDWLAVLELLKIYKKEQPHVIHLNSSKAGIIGSLAAAIYNFTNNTKKASVVFTAHGWVFNPTNDLALSKRWFYIFLHKISAFFQNKIICVSEHDLSLARRYSIAPEKKLLTIHNGIDPDIKFLDKESARVGIAKKNPDSRFQILDSKLPWIGSIGRLVKEKDYLTLVRTAKLVPQANFFIIGAGEKFNELNEEVRKLNLEKRFFLLPPTGNDAVYLKAFDVFVMSSVKEGLPYILLEAMAAGLPAVITEAGGMPEMIKNRENGLMVAQKNPDMLAKAINGLLKNSSVATSLGQMAKKAVREKFNLKEMASQTSQLYQLLF